MRRRSVTNDYIRPAFCQRCVAMYMWGPNYSCSWFVLVLEVLSAHPLVSWWDKGVGCRCILWASSACFTVRSCAWAQEAALSPHTGPIEQSSCQTVLWGSQLVYPQPMYFTRMFQLFNVSVLDGTYRFQAVRESRSLTMHEWVMLKFDDGWDDVLVYM